jgi:hypothetical protein
MPNRAAGSCLALLITPINSPPQMNNKRTNKIEIELLRILTTRNNRSVLARFHDWSAGKAPEDVERGLRFLDRNAGSL